MDLDGAVIGHQTDMTDALSPLEEESTDYVKWQGSQTTCTALNQLIRSSANEPSVANEVSTSRGWQREPSFDQIPGFSLLSTNDNQSQFNSQASSSSSKSSRPSHSRPRPSLARGRSPSVPPDVTNFDLPIPFLDKSNPSLFMDMLKGVSARLDENLGVKPGRGVGPNSTIRATKRVRSAASELQAGRPKRSRAIAPGSALDEAVRPIDKGKRRAVLGGGDAADNHSSMSELPYPLRSSVARSAHVIDDNHTSTSRPLGNVLDQPLKTASQDKMPPPPVLPVKHPTLNPPPRHYPSTATAIASTSLNPSMQHSRSNLRQQSTVINSKSTKPDSGPRYHPLLLEPTSSSTSTSKLPPHASKLQVPTTSTTLPASKPNPQLKPKTEPTAPAFPSVTPKPPSSQSSRPPALGMRRTHTFPSSGMTTSLKTTGVLPTRQKGFKPPLLNASQPSSQVPLGMVPASQPPRQPPSKPANNNYGTAVQMPSGSGGSNGSASSESIRASASSSSGSSFTSKHASSASSSSGPLSPLQRRSSMPKSKTAHSSATTVPESESEPSLPEPLDGDADSSFGDVIPFDLDALEETMRMYD